MTLIPEEPAVFKVDRRGRVHVPRARREALLDEYERSGAAAPAFARLVGVNYATFAGWRAKRRQARAELASPTSALDRPARPPALHLLEAMVEPTAAVCAPGVSALVAELPDGGRLLISAPPHVVWAAEFWHLLGRGGRAC